MKRLIPVMIMLAASLFISCGSTKAETKQITQPVVEEVIIPIFDDWQYKGFGNELPLWAEDAYKNNIDNLAQYFTTPEPSVFAVTITYGVDSDMCEAIADAGASEFTDFELLEKIWVRVNTEYEKLDEPYCSLRIYRKPAVQN